MPMTSHYEFFATAPKYTEGLLLNEIKLLGCEDARETVGGVNFIGNIELAYRVCLWSRIANRVLLKLHKAKILSADDLYDAVYQVAWDQHFDTEQSIRIDFHASGSVIKHSQFGAQKCKDAIVDQFRHNTGERPSVDKLNPDICINVHVNNQNVNIALDLSGHSLHQRGYRMHNVAAPLKENLAAAVLIRSGWASKENQSLPLIDPMCGSGTLLIEAALMITNTAPGLYRTDFGFSHWKQHDADCWQSIVEEARESQNLNPTHAPALLGYDIDPKATEAATSNAELAGVASIVKVRTQGLSELSNPVLPKTGFLITNAPYGERLSDNESLAPLYELLGKKLKGEFVGWHASIITSDEKLLKATRLYAHRKNKIYNGKLLCNIYHFEINEKPLNDKPHQKFNKENDNELEIDEGLKNRLLKNVRHLNKWARKQGVTCYRIYDADIPEFNFALDFYQSDQGFYVFQEYAAPASIDNEKVLHRASVARNTVLNTFSLAASQFFYKQRKKQLGTSQYDKFQEKAKRHIVEEDNCSFYLNFEDYLDTGLFLDHRLTRQMIGSQAKNKNFLNLFSYTGTASVHAAKGGAKSTTSVDMSRTYLSWCEDNFKLNNIPLATHRFIKANCLEWLKKEKQVYDLIFVDPPTFSNSKNMEDIFDVQRDHVELLEDCHNLLSPNGKIIFSTNFRKFRMDLDRLCQLKITDITQQTMPEDFSRKNKAKIHQCWVIEKN